MYVCRYVCRCLVDGDDVPTYRTCMYSGFTVIDTVMMMMMMMCGKREGETGGKEDRQSMYVCMYVCR